MGILGSRPAVVNMALVEQINSTIQQNTVVMYSKLGCPFCTKARKVFQSIGADFLEIDLNKESNTGEWQDALQEITGARSVPRVFVGGKFIGGGSETEALHKSGKLAPMIDAAKQQS